MQRRVRVIGSTEMVNELFKQIEQLPVTTRSHTNSYTQSSLVRREATLKLGVNTYSFEIHNSLFANNLSCDLCIVCDRSDSSAMTTYLTELASKSIPFIPFIESMTINNIIDELRNRHEGLTNNFNVPTEDIVIDKSTTQKLALATNKAVNQISAAASKSAASAASTAVDAAASVAHGAALFAARVEVAMAPTPQTPDTDAAIGNAQL